MRSERCYSVQYVSPTVPIRLESSRYYLCVGTDWQWNQTRKINFSNEIQKVWDAMSRRILLAHSFIFTMACNFRERIVCYPRLKESQIDFLVVIPRHHYHTDPWTVSGEIQTLKPIGVPHIYGEFAFEPNDFAWVGVLVKPNMLSLPVIAIRMTITIERTPCMCTYLIISTLFTVLPPPRRWEPKSTADSW